MPISNILVTGGNGFVGSAIVRALIEKYPLCRVTVLDKVGVKEPIESRSLLAHVEVDITSLQDARKAFLATRPEVVIHTAGLIPSLSERYARRFEKEVFKVNVEGTRNILCAAQEAGCSAFVYTSSCCAVTDDLTNSYANIDERWPVALRSSIYGESKVQAEALVSQAQSPEFSTCVLRPSVIFGECDRQLIPSIHACIEKGETPYKIGDGTNLWDTVYVENVADAHILAVENLLSSKTAAGEVFFIQNNQPISFRDFCLEIWKQFGHYPPYEITIPKTFGRSMGLLAEWFTWFSGMPTTLSRGSVGDACAMRYASGQKARDVLGFEPRIGIEEGISRSCAVSHSEWYLVIDPPS